MPRFLKDLLLKLPPGSKPLLIVLAGLLPLMILAAALSGSRGIYWLGGYLLLIAIAAFVIYLQQHFQASGIRSFNRELRQDFSGSSGIKDAETLNRLAHMQKEFQRGIDLYQQYGKDIYSLPWFVMVGEAGSGKTEAMRRSELSFPDKLANRMQGVGGTYSMHWWFTNHGVVLDTAGRLFVQDGSSGDPQQTHGQWNSFLQLLRRHRPHCPINGLILVIPATTLIAQASETAEQTALRAIEQKTKQIALQMENLKVQLGVRFPVYVLITKTDRIAGFREFFSTFREARDRYQMFGWSNPADLDEGFKFQQFEVSAASMIEKLQKRSLHLMRDPTPQNAENTRLAEVDSLYAFPDSFTRMLPKLKRYLEPIFPSHSKSAKPCFLRGIYFSSALQRGAVLDRALVEALGGADNASQKPLNENDGGEEEPSKAFGRSRAFFLRDMFMEKVFKERGLVTRARLVSAELASGSRWMLGTLVTFIATIIVVGLLSVSSARVETLLWNRVNERGLTDTATADSPENEYSFPILLPERKGWHYEKNRVSDYDALRTKIQKAPELGWMFTPLIWTGEWSTHRQQAFQTAIYRGMILPLTDAALQLLSDPARFSAGLADHDRDALNVLLKLKKAANRRAYEDAGNDAEDLHWQPNEVLVLMRCIFSDDHSGIIDYERESTRIAACLEEAFPAMEWPPANTFETPDEDSPPSLRTRHSRLASVVAVLEQTGATQSNRDNQSLMEDLKRAAGKRS